MFMLLALLKIYPPVTCEGCRKRAMDKLVRRELCIQITSPLVKYNQKTSPHQINVMRSPSSEL